MIHINTAEGCLIKDREASWETEQPCCLRKGSRAHVRAEMVLRNLKKPLQKALTDKLEGKLFPASMSLPVLT